MIQRIKAETSWNKTGLCSQVVSFSWVCDEIEPCPRWFFKRLLEAQGKIQLENTSEKKRSSASWNSVYTHMSSIQVLSKKIQSSLFLHF